MREAASILNDGIYDLVVDRELNHDYKITVKHGDFMRFQDNNELYFPKGGDILKNAESTYKYSAKDGRFIMINN